jgi:hypothetical protein
MPDLEYLADQALRREYAEIERRRIEENDFIYESLTGYKIRFRVPKWRERPIRRLRIECARRKARR